jgi:uncharacterized protein (DUF2384 family)
LSTPADEQKRLATEETAARGGRSVARIHSALRVLSGNSPDIAERWLARPNPELGGKTPRELIEAGRAEAVAELLEGMTLGEPG